jgi:hypothetical protein
LYIPESNIRKEIVDWINSKPDNSFIFDFIGKGGFKGDKTYLEIVEEMLIIRKEMRVAMINTNFDTDFIEKFTIHSWRISNIHYTQSILGQTQYTQARARHANINMTNYYLKATQKHFEKILEESMKKK